MFYEISKEESKFYQAGAPILSLIYSCWPQISNVPCSGASSFPEFSGGVCCIDWACRRTSRILGASTTELVLSEGLLIEVETQLLWLDTNGVKSVLVEPGSYFQKILSENFRFEASIGPGALFIIFYSNEVSAKDRRVDWIRIGFISQMVTQIAAMKGHASFISHGFSKDDAPKIDGYAPQYLICIG